MSRPIVPSENQHKTQYNFGMITFSLKTSEASVPK